MEVIKRNGKRVKFDEEKIKSAIYKAFKSYDKTSSDKKLNYISSLITLNVVDKINKEYKNKISVEEIQDLVEDELISSGNIQVAKNYIKYRYKRELSRKGSATILNTKDLFKNYIEEKDWEVKENSNMGYSLQGLNNRIVSVVSESIWLDDIYPEEVKKAHREGKIHKHDLGLIAPYCCGWDLEDLLLRGFGGVKGKPNFSPPKHLQSALGQMYNFLYTLQGEAAGAQAFSSFDTYLAPFVRFDNLDYNEVKQCIQNFVCNMNISTRVGFQSVFSNITLDVKVPKHMYNEPPIIGGERLYDYKFGDFQKEMDMINKAFCEVMYEGDGDGRIYSFPIPTYNITEDFDWDSEVGQAILRMTAKYGIPYFANFINSDMNPEDVRSMCCRLRLDNRVLRKRGGGLFGANPLTGSIDVGTINMARLGYLHKGDIKGFKRELRELMELIKESQVLKSKVIESNTEKGLYPYSRVYLDKVKQVTGRYWGNHFCTIGINGMNEAIRNFTDDKYNIASEYGLEFAKDIMEYMRDILIEFQEETGLLFNLEATPAESTSFRLAQKDKKLYKDIITAGTEGNEYYTNSTQLPVDFTEDIFEALRLQEDLQSLYTGGTVFHGFFNEKLDNLETLKKLIKTVLTNFKIPYFTYTPTFSICDIHGYLQGEYFNCPKCGRETEVWTRVVGFHRPVKNWNKGKQQEFKDRREFSKVSGGL